ncbi:MAG: 2-oxoglutarate dehydrogenase, partial [Acutalibacteraceae bacterium]
MFGKRSDGRQVHEVEPFQRIIPYIMRTRTDSMNMFEESIPCAGMDGYFSERSAKGDQNTYL